MKIETRFNYYLQEKERQNGKDISLKQIADETSLSVDILKLMKTSHYNNIGCLTLDNILTVCQYFNANFHDFLKIDDSVKTCNEVIDDKDKNETKTQLLTLSRCGTAEEFRRALERSKNYAIYSSVPTLIDSIENLIKKNNGLILAGVSANFNVKLYDENVLIRFFSKDGKVYIKNILFGKSIARDEKKLYKNIYKEYVAITKKDSVETSKDVDILISLVENVIKMINI